MRTEPEPIAIKDFVNFSIKMQMTKTLLPSLKSFLWTPEALEPTLGVRAVVSGVNSGLPFSFVVLSDVSSVNVYVGRIITDI